VLRYGLKTIVAGYEKRVIRERVENGRNAKAKLGLWMGGSTPLGYDVIDKRLVLTDREVEQLGISEVDFVKLLFHKMLEGHTTYSLTKWLNQLGI
jgi:DNA invertase Pin-like site-specific DNA recombinase